MKGKLIQNKYLVLKTLAGDSFSESFLARKKDLLSRRRYIIKQFRADKIDRTFYQTASIFKRLSGSDRQIPQLYEYFTVGEYFYIVREWIAGLTLKQKVEQRGKLSAAEVELILTSILGCLNYIHGYGIVYGRLKPNNIVLRPPSWTGRSPTGCLPVPLYFEGVGELANSDRHDLVLTERRGCTLREDKFIYASDLYSLGLTAIYLLTGKNPAELPVDPQTKQILWHQEAPQLNIHLTRTLDRAICPDPQDRFTSAKAMLHALNSLPASISLPFSRASSKNTGSEVKIVAILAGIGLGVFGVALTILDPQFAPFSQAEVEELKYPIAEVQIEAIAPSSSSNSTFDIERRTPFSIPVFTVGVPQQQAIAHLGQPSRQGKGYWQNSRAFLYRDFIPGIDLGYLADTNTNIIRQSEMSFAPGIDVQTIQHSARLLLADNYSLEIARQIDLVYSARSDRQEFKINDIEGVVQRNPRNYIYFAIWDRQFH